ncbi:(S)-ureidoglycine aminohydrolase [Pseudomonas sp. FW306-02-F02-AA]|uniref:Cupin n=1 Tax=Pseudomonas fluorescens TaxID=294 RepID=A0A0N9WP82_PSEFL|nr:MULTISPECIES: cupin domain-containing protein [Pseudomonas]ALI03766.1 cupin [Pseudomonas fluorescens]PMZ03063.1 (S)-ureidoglycine aminohydrolase [Pseudomonas sp. FW306-02-F02-AB]PMZ11851.1 (S)-ureidoglycine aminohydrolase [Pseudomonas sp. FW306-02-H06C]PMZ14473.1 (S)-ureidoglycine aminohydrolase [Pseudomonas sp. FW306-02-F02-AA]PMZ20514.1 (S)-ureidoglycine aminohydrolase [Pseudomonas sp. FW306-02-F08-AA]
MNFLRFCAAPLIALTLTVSTSAFAHEAAGHQEKVTMLQDQMLLNAPGKKAMMLVVDYQPGQASIAHKHQGTAMAYVVSGEVTSQVKGEQAITYKAGESWYEPAGSEHLISKNASATKPAKLLVFMLMDKTDEVLIPLKN